MARRAASAQLCAIANKDARDEDSAQATLRLPQQLWSEEQ
jgi:hypothetical protein